MDYQIKITELFNEQFKKIIPKQYHEDIKRRISKLKENPFIGKPLGDKYLRELKLKKFRIYFIIFEKKIIVFLVAISDKKDQKKIIQLVKDMYPELENIVKNINTDI